MKELAERLHVSEHAVAGWEESRKRPTLIQLRKVAKVCKRPLAALLLAEPPKEPPLPQDFRSLPSAEQLPLGSKTLLAIRRARRLQAIAKEINNSLKRRRFEEIGRYKETDDPEIVAARVREHLGVGVETQRSWPQEDVALTEWIKAVEEFEVLVFRLGFPMSDARAFSLGDDEFPAIMLNTGDSTHGKIFSLFHELGHLLLNRPGICDWKEGVRNQRDSIEIHCNHFAGAFLVPGQALLEDERVQNKHLPDRWPDEVLDELSSTFKVSREVILRRLLILGQTSNDFYESKRLEWAKQSKSGQSDIHRRQPSPAKRCIRDNGNLFVSLVLDAHRRGDITYVDVADYLGTRLGDIPTVEQMAGARH